MKPESESKSRKRPAPSSDEASASQRRRVSASNSGAAAARSSTDPKIERKAPVASPDAEPLLPIASSSSSASAAPAAPALASSASAPASGPGAARVGVAAGGPDDDSGDEDEGEQDESESDSEDEFDYHPGELEVDYESDTWADHDERCHGPIDTKAHRREYPEGFKWSCCDAAGDEPGCETRDRPQTPVSPDTPPPSGDDGKRYHPGEMEVLCLCFHTIMRVV